MLRNRTNRSSRLSGRMVAGCLLVVWVALSGSAPVFAGHLKSSESRARAFLDKPSVGRQIHNLMHLGTTYDGHALREVTGVSNATGGTIEGHFTLTYRFTWDRQWTTDLVFFCDEDGDIYRLQVERSDGQFQSPFVAAQATIAIFGEVFYEAVKDNLSETERSLLRGIINRADVKSFCLLQLMILQAGNK